MTGPGRNDMVWIVTQWGDRDRAIRGVYRHARDAYARAAELTHGQVERDALKVSVMAHAVIPHAVSFEESV